MTKLWIFILTTFTVTALPFNQANEKKNKHINGENGWYVPQWDGTFEWMTVKDGDALLEQLEGVEMSDERFSTVPVKYFLYTQANPIKGEQITDSEKSINNSIFNPGNPTRILIHGWTQSYTSPMNQQIRDAWLGKGAYNIITMDWARARSIDYASSVVAIRRTAQKLANMIDFLVSKCDMSLNTLHIIGHSLGAHVAGYAGKQITTGQVQTIIGLDPALPLFHYAKPSKRLSDKDAFYVESIQTNGGQLGFLKPIGRGAFYPNGGKSQTGCGHDLTGACAHSRSFTYYVEAVRNDSFSSIKCADYTDAVDNACGTAYSWARMGSQSNMYVVSGYYYVPVNGIAPHGMSAN